MILYFALSCFTGFLIYTPTYICAWHNSTHIDAFPNVIVEGDLRRENTESVLQVLAQVNHLVLVVTATHGATVTFLVVAAPVILVPLLETIKGCLHHHIEENIEALKDAVIKNAGTLRVVSIQYFTSHETIYKFWHLDAISSDLYFCQFITEYITHCCCTNPVNQWGLVGEMVILTTGIF